MVQKRKMYTHLGGNSILSESRGREMMSIGDADAAYANRRPRPGQSKRQGAKEPLSNIWCRRKSRYDELTDSLSSDYYDKKNTRDAVLVKNLTSADTSNAEEEAEVIDLGSPVLPRRLAPSITEASQSTLPRRSRVSRLKFSYQPNPRLYPGLPRNKPRHLQIFREESTSSPQETTRPRRRLHRRRLLRTTTPNPRLYRPPQRKIQPPSTPQKQWTPPPSALDDTASKVAMRLFEKRNEAQENRQIIYQKQETFQGRQVVYKKRDTSEKKTAAYKLAQKGVKMKNDIRELPQGTAPPEYLAEFVATIMRGEYAEALQYCRLVLSYEPHNSTALDFYPLLLRKMRDLSKRTSNTDSDKSQPLLNIKYYPEMSKSRHEHCCFEYEHQHSDRSWSRHTSSGSLSTSMSLPPAPALKYRSHHDTGSAPRSVTSSWSSKKLSRASSLHKRKSKASVSSTPPRTPSLEHLRAMFTHSLINSTEISSSEQKQNS